MANAKKAPSARERLREIEAEGNNVSPPGFMDRVMENVRDKEVRSEIIAVQRKARGRMEKIRAFMSALANEHDVIQKEIKQLRAKEIHLLSSIDAKQGELKQVSEELIELERARESILANERKLDIQNRALAQQVKELTTQRDSALAKAEALSRLAQQSQQVASAQAQDDLAKARAEIAELKAQAQAKRQAHGIALNAQGKTIEELRSEVEKLNADRASMQVELDTAKKRLRDQREDHQQVLCAMQEPAPPKQGHVSEIEFYEMSIALSRSHESAEQALEAAERWKLYATSASKSLTDMKEALAEALRFNSQTPQAKEQDRAETVALKQELEIAIASLRRLAEAKAPKQNMVMARHLVEQNQLLTERLQKAMQSGSYWHGIAQATQAECGHLANQVSDLQQQLSQIIASDDAMLRQLLKESEETPS